MSARQPLSADTADNSSPPRDIIYFAEHSAAMVLMDDHHLSCIPCKWPMVGGVCGRVVVDEVVAAAVVAEAVVVWEA